MIRYYLSLTNSNKTKKQNLVNKLKSFLKKVLTKFESDDKIKKSLEGDKKKWSLKIEQNNI